MVLSITSAPHLLGRQPYMSSYAKRRRAWTKLSILISLVAFPVLSLFAQPLSFQDSWRWAHFTTETGLPSNHVYCIAETPDSTVWAGTQNGLAWFDGYVWTAMDTTQGIPADLVSVIEPYGKDSVLCIVNGALYLGGKTHFRLLAESDSTIKSMQSVVLTNRNQIFVLGNIQLFVLDSGKVTAASIPARPISDGPRNLWRTASGTIWLNTVNGLYRTVDHGWKLTIPLKGYPARIRNVVEDKYGNGVAAIIDPREVFGIREWSKKGMAHPVESERSGGQLAMDISPSGDVLVLYQTGEIRLRHKGEWSDIQPRPEQFNSALAQGNHAGREEGVEGRDDRQLREGCAELDGRV